MADPIEYQVPLVSGICSSQSSMDQYVQSLNMALDLAVQVINEELGEDFSLPGIPPLPLPKSPDILLPELMPWERRLRLGNTPVPTGHLGNVFPLRNNKKSVSGKLAMPGVPEALIGAPSPGAVPGVDPSTYIINFLNQNIELMFQFLIDQGFDVSPITFPTVEICNDDTLGQGASPGQVIINELLRQNLKNALEPVAAATGCLPIFNDATYTFASSASTTDGCWELFANPFVTFPSPVVITSIASPESMRFAVSGGTFGASLDPFARATVNAVGCYCLVVTGGEAINLGARFTVSTFSLPSDPADNLQMGVRARQVLSNGGLADRAADSVTFTSTGTSTVAPSGTAAVPGSVFSGAITFTNRVILQLEVDLDIVDLSVPYSYDCLFDQLSMTLT